ncbi:hypothetical protein CTAYLR_003474 [Chrysophaeum taylorii]|uniref:EamA domain-containing protein n=1 Tax=Chrysophaeum taylorii TaxID=2483200 RepID=A0AAD7UAM0_9STRA|nr:hypothetical protein CTAYLR_003474 [Chrysophaeum taylorii]
MRRLTGVGLALAGALAISPDALCLLLASRHSTAATVTFARLVLCGAAYFAIGLGRRERLPWTWEAAVLAVLVGYITAAMTFAFLFTYTATAVVLFALGPVWAALMSYFWLGDPLERRTVCAIVLAIVGVGIIAGSVNGSDLVGSALAFFAGICYAAYLTIVRRARLQDIAYLAGAGCLGAASILIAVVPVAVPTTPLFYGAVAGSVAGACAFYVAQGRAVYYITAAETSLCTIIEVPFAATWVYLACNQTPPLATLCAGALIVLVLLVHESIPVLCDTAITVPVDDTKNAVDSKDSDASDAVNSSFASYGATDQP